MKLKDLKISKQIDIYFSAVFIIVAILVANSFLYVDALWENTSGLYNNPLTVRRAVGDIKVDVLLIHRDMRQLPFEDSQREIEQLLGNIETCEADMDRQLATLYDRYLGPQADIDEVSEALTRWKAIRNETVRLLRAGHIEEVAERVKSNGVGGAQTDLILSHLTDISDFAMLKSDDFFQTAQEHRNQIMVQMIFLCAGLLVLLVVIGLYLRKGILPPLATLAEATEAINRGEMDTRVRNDSPNELGDLSRAFDTMAETIQTEMEYRKKVARISAVMFQHGTLREFCQELLRNLLEMTDSQLGAIYLLEESANRFERYESIGVLQDELSSFAVAGKEGEFGVPLASKKVHHVTDIPADAQMVFSTVSGDYKAKEIITIPIAQGNDTVSMISLASIKRYSAESIQLVNGLVNEITASFNAVMSSQRILEFSQKLQSTNAELEQQTRELEMQADELAEQNAELEMQKNQLDEASRLKTNFLSNMSHELRTPLNSVIALSGVLGRRLADKIPADECSYLEIIERNGRNLLTMINDILDISRIEAGREEIEITRFNTNDTISEVVSMIQPQAQQQNIELFLTSSDSGITIESDASKFQHILQNLIGNAVKFTEAGSVEISSTKIGNSIAISVKDTGIGISEESIPHIFDEFRQADGSTSRRFGGTGLGLAIAKKYADLLGGTIAVTSSPGVGSEFILTLPLHYTGRHYQSEQSGIGTDTNSRLQSFQHDVQDLSGKTILLVEDNESAIIQIKDLVEDLGCQVHVAHDAIEAFAIIDQTIPDAMILDLMMPDVDGFKVLGMLRNAEPTAHIPVLILTAKHITKEELRFLKRNNIHQLIQKGDVKRLELQHAVSTMLHPDKPKVGQVAGKPRAFEGKPVVLVVEDNVDNMITVKALLGDNHIVLEASTAQEGMEMARKQVPNLILMDIALPDINGIEAFRKIRRTPQTQHIPVIALTASVMRHERETILSHGFDAFIAKPIIASDFFQVIDGVLYGK
ncbi:MAG: hybrid sensor histidine kinase/response regulator [Spirochaetae bacterium HGW-Spirochaetae-2]|jgi:signal transduction histidine kinase/CheY-like chemotaxis protein|nr:MAG: hybrid sensor histidine kinase/response regulator [Spirochaetae bacterium HGW-Spirochaetae-2]